MMTLHKIIALPLIALLASCGLTDTFPEYQGPLDGQSCGPCGLGRTRGSSCDLGVLDGSVPEDTTCESLIFVITDGNGDGTFDNPTGSLTDALKRAKNISASAILIQGDHTGPLELVNGVSILGGFDNTWRVRSGRSIITTTGQDPNGDVTCLFGEGINAPTRIERIDCQTDGVGHSYYGGRLIGSSGVSFHDVNLFSKQGTAGQRGANGQQGEDGDAGEEGTSSGIGGLPGIQSTCDSRGGKGGQGAIKTDGASQNAEEGFQAPNGGRGGTINQDGRPGDNGDAGANAARNTDPITLSTNGLVSIPLGAIGDIGNVGVGGGGGGGGEVSSTGTGGGGGGGGSGGCPGTGGQPGMIGGSSIGLVLLRSTPTQVRNLTITTLDGGLGGAGGMGGAGGDGQPGGRGGAGQGSGEEGGRGGDGGDGGTGGQGAPGRGGLSLALLCKDTTLTDDVRKQIATTQGQSGFDANMIAQTNAPQFECK